MSRNDNANVAIPTNYRGTKFRSRLEARWAEFLDSFGVEWEYEPQGYASGSVTYLPDFWLPKTWSRGKPGGVFLEIKPGRPSEDEQVKAKMLAVATRRPVLIVEASPRLPSHESLLEFVSNERGDWEDDGLSFGKCADCGTVNVGHYVRDRQCGSCGLGLADPYEATLMQARKNFNELARWRAA